MTNAYFYERKASPEMPAGLTVSKQPKLPDGEFDITEYVWGETSLCFIDQDNFTAEEREATYLSFVFQGAM